MKPEVPEDDVPLMEFIYLVYTRMPVSITVDDSVGLCCCVHSSGGKQTEVRAVVRDGQK